MTNERLKEIFEIGEKLERIATKKLNIQENTITRECEKPTPLGVGWIAQ